MATKKKGTKAKAPGAVVKRVISVPAGTKEIVLHIRIGKGTGKAMKLMMASSSPIEPDPLGGNG